MTKTRAKAIKLYLNIAKERCPFHNEEMVNSFLEGFMDCAEYFILQNTELEKENAELKEKLKPENCIEYLAKGGYVKFLCENVNEHDQLTKAKKLLERLLITSCNSDVLNLLPNCSEVLRVRVEAEQFLSEVEK